MSLTFAIEPIAPVWDEFCALAHLHWEGTKGYRRHEPLDLRLMRYKTCNETGFLQFCAARDAGKLVGYLTFYTTHSMHSQRPMAVEDAFFLHPDYRRGRNAFRMLQFVEQQCRTWGAEELLCSCEIDNASGIQRLLEFLDYEPVIVQYRKRLIDSPRADSAQHLHEEATHVRPKSSATA